jgi:hypothetical protein
MSRVFAGCRLTRDIPSLISHGGFQIDEIEAAYLSDFPRSLTYCWWAPQRGPRHDPEHSSFRVELPSSGLTFGRSCPSTNRTIASIMHTRT